MNQTIPKVKGPIIDLIKSQDPLGSLIIHTVKDANTNGNKTLNQNVIGYSSFVSQPF
jgi:hypothetical protein